jgi:hypothetical protein
MLSLPAVIKGQVCFTGIFFQKKESANELSKTKMGVSLVGCLLVIGYGY